MHRFPSKDARDHAQSLIELGFSFEGTDGSGHMLFRHPNGARIHAPSTASDWRSYANSLSQARRAAGLSRDGNITARLQNRQRRRLVDLTARTVRERTRAARRQRILGGLLARHRELTYAIANAQAAARRVPSPRAHRLLDGLISERNDLVRRLDDLGIPWRSERAA